MRTVTVTIPGEALMPALRGVQQARHTMPLCEERHALAYAAQVLIDAQEQWARSEAERRKAEFEAELEGDEVEA